MMSFDDLVLDDRSVQAMITENSYCGRGLGIGRNDKGHYVFVYFLTGRSTDSQNRGFVEKGGPNGIVRTAQVKKKKIPKKKRRLIIYTALAVKQVGDRRFAFATNGAQTETLLRLMKKETGFLGILGRWNHEPDQPNNTARISGMISFGEDGRSTPSATLSMIKCDPVLQVASRVSWPVNLNLDGGHMVTTYREDGKPLPPFEGLPFPIQLHGNARQIGQYFWSALPEKTKVSLVVRTFKRNGEVVSTFIKNGRGEPKG